MAMRMLLPTPDAPHWRPPEALANLRVLTELDMSQGNWYSRSSSVDLLQQPH